MISNVKIKINNNKLYYNFYFYFNNMKAIKNEDQNIF